MKDIIRNYFVGQKNVLCVYLFGSVARGKENKFSDIDVAVLFDVSVPQGEHTEIALSIMDDLSRILNKDVDVVVLNSAASFLKFQIIKMGLKIYERPNRIEHGFEAGAIVEYLDFFPVRKRLEAALINNIKKR